MKKIERYVYFIRIEDGSGYIRIGCSLNPKRRHASLGKSSPYKLTMVASGRGGFAEENALHWTFREHRILGEWFAENPELTELLQFVQKTGRIPEKYSEKREAIVKRLANEGKTHAAISTETFVSLPRVGRILFDPTHLKAKTRRLGDPVVCATMDHTQITPSMIEDMALEARVTISEILEKSRVSRGVFYRWRRGEGEPLPLTKLRLYDAASELVAERDNG